jgi:hypothetical protein
MGTAVVPTQAMQRLARRAARFEEELAVACTPVDLVAVSSAQLRSILILRSVNPDLAARIAQGLVDYCRQAISALNSENTGEAVASASAGRWPR